MNTAERPPLDWSGEALNQVPDSDNRIHSDELARAYGFTGALVPGVTVSCYLVHPAVLSWGMPWLERGAAHVKVLSPLYDRDPFKVVISRAEYAADHGMYLASLYAGERECATGEIRLPHDLPPAPQRRGDPLITSGHEAPEATPDSMEALQRHGCPAHHFEWSPRHEMARYLREQGDMAPPLRTDGQQGSGGYANMAFLLGCANRHFAAVAQMSPWIHLETRSQNFMAVPSDTQLISEMTVLELFNRKGHDFADCQFHLFRADDGRCVCSIEQRAIYRMRPPE